MKLRRFFTASARRVAASKNLPRTQLQIEALESRLVPYSLSGNAWPHPELVTLSFMPDGTNLGGVTSNLFSTMNAKWAPAVWQQEILRAAQVWAQVTNLNFALVNDSGGDSGSGLNQQGDPAFGDIRVGAYNSGASNLGSAMLPPPSNNYSVAGDFTLNSTQPWTINQAGGYDLFTVAAHEIGHTLGLYHSTVSSAEEYSFYNAVKSSLRADDIAGIRGIYSGGLGRFPDVFDVALSNGSFATATDLTLQVNPVTQTALVPDLDLTTISDQDYYSVVAPLDTSGSLTVNVQSHGLSMLMPTLTVYDALQQPLGTASGKGQYGSTLSLTVNGVLPGQRFYVKVAPAESTAFGTGKYALALNLGAGALPTVPLPDTQTAIGIPLRGGGGVGTRNGDEVQVNQEIVGSQTTFSDAPNRNAVAMNSWGESVIVWASESQDGSGAGVYGSIFGPDGVAWSGEIAVNTYTLGHQYHPVVALDEVGGFIIAWMSQGQDADSSWGIYAQRFDYLGAPVGTEFAVANGLGDEKYPAIASAGDGRFVLTWVSPRVDGSGWNVSARLYDAAGQALGNAFVVNPTVAATQNPASVAMDPTGNFVIAWNSPDGLGGTHAYSKLYDAAGQTLRDEQRVNATTGDMQDQPAVAKGADGDYLVTWSSHDQGSWGVYGQWFTLDGLPRDSAFRVNSANGSDQWYSTADILDNGDTVISWMSFAPDGSNAGIFAQLYAPAGQTSGPEMAINTTQTGNQWYPSVAASGADGFIVVWSGTGARDDAAVLAQRMQVVSQAGGVALTVGDFLTTGQPAKAVGCSACAALTAVSTPNSDCVNALLQASQEQAVRLAPVSPLGLQPPTPVAAANNVVPAVPRTAVDSPRFTQASTALLVPPALFPEAESTMPAPTESAPVVAERLSALPLQGDRWKTALDAYFVEATLQSMPPTTTEPAGPTEASSPTGEPVTPLAGVGLILGGLWTMFPNKATPRRRPAQRSAPSDAESPEPT